MELSQEQVFEPVGEPLVNLKYLVLENGLVQSPSQFAVLLGGFI